VRATFVSTTLVSTTVVSTTFVSTTFVSATLGRRTIVSTTFLSTTVVRKNFVDNKTKKSAKPPQISRKSQKDPNLKDSDQDLFGAESESVIK